MEGYQVTVLEDVVGTADIFVSATGNDHIITVDHMQQMKHNAIVCNIGHFDSEIDMAGLARSGATHDQLKPGTDLWSFPDGHSIIVLAEGRLVNLGCATGHPSFVMSCSFSNQVIAQMELFSNVDQYPLGVHVLPKRLDEKVAVTAPRRARREVDQAHRRASRVPRRRALRPLQARPLPVLSFTSSAAPAACGCVERCVRASVLGADSPGGAGSRPAVLGRGITPGGAECVCWHSLPASGNRFECMGQ